MSKSQICQTNALDYDVFGKSVRRVDGLEKVTGEALYLDNIKLPGMLYGKILRSPHPHAKILDIDISEAEKLKGVRTIITYKDTPGILYSFEQAYADKQILCEKVVRCVGDEVAAVAADDPVTAEHAIELIKVNYEPLPAVFEPEEAIKPGAPLVHEEKESNIASGIHLEFGRVEEVFSHADYVIEDSYTTSEVAHCCLESRGCIGLWEQRGKATVWSPTQAPHTLRQELARVLNIPIGNTKVIATTMGGAFGSRLVMDPKEPIALILSRRTGRPVKIVNTRSEEFQTAGSRYSIKYKIKTAVSKEGKILARDVKAVLDNGAYNDKGRRVANGGSNSFATFYNPIAARYDAQLIYTNKPHGTAFRGLGNPQAHFVIERQMDKIAQILSMDPLELRLRNCHYPNQVTNFGQKITSCGLKECMERATSIAGWSEKKSKNNETSGTKRRGIGMAAMLHSGGGTRAYGYNGTDTFLKVSEDGKVTVITPVVEMGQGSLTVISQIIAEVLGISTENVTVITGDTDIMPYDLGGFASRLTFVAGNAAKSAAEDAKREITEVASKMFSIPEDKLILQKGRIFPEDNPGAGASFVEVVSYAVSKLGRAISGKGRYVDEIEKTPQNRFPVFSFGCQVAEVEVDLETGCVKVINLVAAHDTGKTVNPLMTIGQIEGAVAQGIGYALHEEQVFNSEGHLLNPNFLDYKICRSADMPQIHVELIESNEPEGPFGAKGVGEPGLLPTAPAIVNAIVDALGIEFNGLPVTPEKVLKALRHVSE